MMHPTFSDKADILDYTRVAMQIDDYRDYLVMLDKAMHREIQSRNASNTRKPSHD